MKPERKRQKLATESRMGLEAGVNLRQGKVFLPDLREICGVAVTYLPPEGKGPHSRGA